MPAGLQTFPNSRGFIDRWVWGKLMDREDDFACLVGPFWFDHIREFQFKLFCLPVKISCAPAENVDENPAAV